MNAEEQLLAEDRRKTAYHEAGHAVVAWERGYELDGLELTLDPETMQAGSSRCRPKILNDTEDPLELISCFYDRIAIDLAGSLAVFELTHDRERAKQGTANDHAAALQSVTQIQGLAEAERAAYPEKYASLEVPTADQCFEEGASRALPALRAHWAAVDALAGELFTHQVLTGPETTEIIERAVQSESG